MKSSCFVVDVMVLIENVLHDFVKRSKYAIWRRDVRDWIVLLLGLERTLWIPLGAGGKFRPD